MARHCPTSAKRRLPRVRQVVVTSRSPVTVMPSVLLHSACLDSPLDTSSLSHPATRHHISLAYPIVSVIARICHTLASAGTLGALQMRPSNCVHRIVVTCYEYYAKCLAFSIRQCHTLRLAIARPPIRLLGQWLDTVQPRPAYPITRSMARHCPTSAKGRLHASGKSSSHPGVPSL
jgi:hypothetical protein